MMKELHKLLQGLNIPTDQLADLTLEYNKKTSKVELYGVNYKEKKGMTISFVNDKVIIENCFLDNPLVQTKTYIKESISDDEQDLIDMPYTLLLESIVFNNNDSNDCKLFFGLNYQNPIIENEESDYISATTLLPLFNNLDIPENILKTFIDAKKGFLLNGRARFPEFEVTNQTFKLIKDKRGDIEYIDGLYNIGNASFEKYQLLKAALDVEGAFNKCKIVHGREGTILYKLLDVLQNNMADENSKRTLMNVVRELTNILKELDIDGRIVSFKDKQTVCVWPYKNQSQTRKKEDLTTVAVKFIDDKVVVEEENLGRGLRKTTTYIKHPLSDEEISPDSKFHGSKNKYELRACSIAFSNMWTVQQPYAINFSVTYPNTLKATDHQCFVDEQGLTSMIESLTFPANVEKLFKTIYQKYVLVDKKDLPRLEIKQEKLEDVVKDQTSPQGNISLCYGKPEDIHFSDSRKQVIVENGAWQYMKVGSNYTFKVSKDNIGKASIDFSTKDNNFDQAPTYSELYKKAQAGIRQLVKTPKKPRYLPPKTN